MALNVEKLAQRNSADDLLKAFLLKEVAFRIENQMINVPKISQKKLDALINDLAMDLSNETEVLFDFDRIDTYLKTQIDALIRVNAL